LIDEDGKNMLKKYAKKCAKKMHKMSKKKYAEKIYCFYAHVC